MFTIGQRKGLPGGSAQPRYVVDIDPETNRVLVGGAEDLVKFRCDHRHEATSSNCSTGGTGREIGGHDEDGRARIAGRAKYGGGVRPPRRQQILAGPGPAQHRASPGDNSPGNRLHGPAMPPRRGAPAPAQAPPGASPGALPSLPRSPPLEYDGTLLESGRE
jgi:hypothetical protein